MLIVMPQINASNTPSSYAEITSGPIKTSIAQNNSPNSVVMDAKEVASRKEELNLPCKKSDNPSQSLQQKNVSESVGKKNIETVRHLTPQQRPSNYYGEYNSSHVSPESTNTISAYNAKSYDGSSLFPQQSVSHGFHNDGSFSDGTSAPPGGLAYHQQYIGNSAAQQTPNSPTQSMSGIPPASPLFPRVAFMGTSKGNESSTMSPIPSGYVSSGMYIPGNSYPFVTGRPNSSTNTVISSSDLTSSSNDDFMTWNDTRNMSYPMSPGHTIPYMPGIPQRPDRSSSFDSVLPSGSDTSSVQQAPSYGSVPGGGPQQAWGYGGPHHGVTQQVRSGMLYSGQHGGPQFRSRDNAHYVPQYGGHFGYYASPGPPIQTSSTNKGPDGANLFIFHIPNHFSNMDMYQLFSQYGNLLSVRIMVEKGTGRSRGFGFVSYDNTDSAALAIKELNGYPIGNKRLKVQHKQIRPTDHRQQEHSASNSDRGGKSANGDKGSGANLPPSGLGMSGWYNNERGQIGPSSSLSAQMLVSGGDGGGKSDQHNVVVVVDDDPNSPTVKATTAASGSSDDQSKGQFNQQQKDNTDNDPLSKMEPLRQALPETGA